VFVKGIVTAEDAVEIIAEMQKGAERWCREEIMAETMERIWKRVRDGETEVEDLEVALEIWRGGGKVRGSRKQEEGGELEVNESVVYDGNENVTVKGVHRDDGKKVYYTIVMGDGREKQTVRDRLRKVGEEGWEEGGEGLDEFVKIGGKIIEEGVKLLQGGEGGVKMRVCMALSVVLGKEGGNAVGKGKGLGSVAFELRKWMEGEGLGVQAVLGGNYGTNWRYIIDDVGGFVERGVGKLEDGDFGGIKWVERAAVWAVVKDLVKIKDWVGGEIEGNGEGWDGEEWEATLKAVRAVRMGVRKKMNLGFAIRETDFLIDGGEIRRGVERRAGNVSVTSFASLTASHIAPLRPSLGLSLCSSQSRRPSELG